MLAVGLFQATACKRIPLCKWISSIQLLKAKALQKYASVIERRERFCMLGHQRLCDSLCSVLLSIERSPRFRSVLCFCIRRIPTYPSTFKLTEVRKTKGPVHI
jgi:hypothetical protein